MRAVVQRVSEASVSIGGQVVGACGRGYVVLLGVGAGDTEAEVERLWSKIAKLRIFPDGEHHTGAALADVDGEVLIVREILCARGDPAVFAASAAAVLGCREAVFFLPAASGGEPYVTADAPLTGGTVWNLTLD